MQVEGARVLVAGATGELGGRFVRALLERGAEVAPAGRDEHRLADVAERCGRAGIVLDVVDAGTCRRAVEQAVADLGGLDAVVVATGVAAFGPAAEADAAVVEELFAVDVLGPMTLVRESVARMEPGGVVVGVSAVLADLPTAQMAEYSAAKAAFSTWLGVLGREERRRLHVVDVRPPHLDTALSEHPLVGEAPRLPDPFPADRVVEVTLEAMAGRAREVVWDADAHDVVAR